MAVDAVAQPPGPAADAQGRTATDPSPNVLDLVRAHDRRQDDLRDMQERCNMELNRLRAEYEDKLREAEAKRIDAIRAVDVGAVSRAAEVAAQQAGALQTQTSTLAETLRVQVSAAATAASTQLSTAISPLQTAIDDLRRTQYQQAGERAQVVEARDAGADKRGASNLVIALVGLGITIVLGGSYIIGMAVTYFLATKGK